jgi:hypothetical protein
MSQDRIDTERVVRLLLHDAIPTLGRRAGAEILRLAANYEALAGEWMRHGESVSEAQRSFDRSVVDELQQTAHDEFWDTTWPACPLHQRHPLWYDDERDAWCCLQDDLVVARLGELGDAPPAGPR